MSSTPPFSEHQPTALIVEDEPALCDELQDMLAAIWPELHIVARAYQGLEALRLIAEHEPDIVFLDIQIPEPSGLEIAQHLADRCHIVFVTAYDAHAIEAFEKGAVDYLLKPLAASRLFLTVQRLKQHLLQKPVAQVERLQQLQKSSTPARYLRWITAPVGKTLRMIMIDDVLFFQSDTKYTRVVLSDSEVLIKRSLKELLTELDPELFWQIHRSTVVNAQAIDVLEPDFRGRLTVRLKSRDEALAVSETFMHRFRQR